MNIQAPTLETERLRLRHHTKDDYDKLVAMWSDPKVFQLIGGVAYSAQQTWSRLLAWIGHWPVMGYGYWLVEEKVSGSFVGQIGLADFKRGIQTIEGLPEAGWVLTLDAHGKGYATEGVRAALTWADTYIKSQSVVCIISPENTPSIKIAQKFNFHETTRIVYQEKPANLYTRTTSENE